MRLRANILQALGMKKTLESDLDRSREQLCRLEDERNDALITVQDQESEIHNYEKMVCYD